MDQYTHSFIVKIWVEETVDEAGKTTWRGHITHVPSGERRYFQELESVPKFIFPYLKELGVSEDQKWQYKLKSLFERLQGRQHEDSEESE